jgi:hypothetical protein
MSGRPTFTNTIHLRDFVDNISHNPHRPNSPNHVSLHTEINVFDEGGFLNSSITAEPIAAQILAYVRPEKRSTYC